MKSEQVLMQLNTDFGVGRMQSGQWTAVAAAWNEGAHSLRLPRLWPSFLGLNR